MPELDPKAREILDFWFFPDYVAELLAVLQKGERLWWHSKNAEVDRQIAERFTGDLERAGRGDYDHWTTSSDGAMAFLILVDQMPRHIYRDDPRAWSFDDLALRHCRAALDAGLDAPLDEVKRYFFYLPLMHAEDPAVQEESIARYRQLLDDAGEDMKMPMELVWQAAKRHHEIVERFGRFPHRNQALARPSTPEEEAFLKEPDSSF